LNKFFSLEKKKMFEYFVYKTLTSPLMQKQWSMTKKDCRYAGRNHGLPYNINYKNNKIVYISIMHLKKHIKISQEIFFSIVVDDETIEGGYIERTISKNSSELICFNGRQDTYDVYSKEDDKLFACNQQIFYRSNKKRKIS